MGFVDSEKNIDYHQTYLLNENTLVQKYHQVVKYDVSLGHSG